MKTQLVIDYFGTQQKVADALSVNQASIAKWLKSGSPPYLRQLQLQMLTKGKLKADTEANGKKSKRMCEPAQIQPTKD